MFHLITYWVMHLTCLCGNSSGLELDNRFGSGSGDIWLDDVACRGNESSLSQCSHNGWGVHDCGHDQDVSVGCFSGANVITDIRLSGSGFSGEGRLEIKVLDHWGTVCDDLFDDNDAAVACNMLGFGRSGRSLGNLYGAGVGEIFMDELQCSGSEDNLADCAHNGWLNHDCGHHEDVSIRCT